MKRILVLLMAGFVSVAVAQQSPLLTQAQKAYMAGDVATAKSLFEKVLQLEPKNKAALNYLQAIKIAEAQAGPGAQIEKQLQALILPKVEYQNASLISVINDLKQKGSVSFVLLGVDKETQITLSLTNIPFLEVVRYVAAQANAEYKVDRYAITLKPKAAQ